MWKQKKTDNIIVLSALSLLIVFSYLLYDDSFLFSDSEYDKANAIGNVSNTQNDVRKKNSGTFSWLPTQNKEFVFQNDSIFTGEGSEANIQLNDGSIITIKENSLITLNKKNGEMLLDLKFGNFQGDISQNSNLKIKTGGEEYEIKGATGQSKVQFSKARSGSVKVKLIKGSAEVSSKSTGKKTINQDENISIDKGIVKELPKPKLELLTKDNLAINKFIEEDSFDLEWRGQEIFNYQVLIFTSSNTSNPIFSKSVDLPKVNVNNGLPAGQYQWQVRGYDNSGNSIIESPVRAFTVTVFKPPVVLKPDLNSIISKEITIRSPDQLKLKTDIIWEADQRLAHYYYEIASDSQFSNIIVKGETKERSIKTPDLTNGSYYVRVRGEYNKRLTKWSPIHSFNLQLIAKDEPRPQAPELVQRKIEFIAPLDLNTKLKSRDPASIPAPEIRWSKVENSALYKLQLANDLSFTNPISIDTTKETIKWQNYQPGTYYIRVYAKGANDLYSYSSKVGLLKIKTQQPVINQVNEINIKDTDPQANPEPQLAEVSWTPVPFAKKYQVQINDTPDFKKAKSYVVPEPYAKVPVPKPGKYFVRVQAYKENNSSISDYSEPTPVSYSFTTVVGKPSLQEPLNQTTLFLQQDMAPFVWLEWQPVKYASNYRIEISTTADFSSILISEKTSSPKYLISQKVPYGKIYWRVQAESDYLKSQSDWSESREFVILQQKNEFFIR